jgi:hypothetical protein
MRTIHRTTHGWESEEDAVAIGLIQESADSEFKDE